MWLSEGPATLYEYYIPDLLFPDDGYMQLFREQELFTVFRIDVPTSPTSIPMSYYVCAPKDIDNKFDDISYAKGGVFMRMFQEAFTVSTFAKGLSKYLKKMSFSAAVPNDLFSSMQEAYDEDYLGNNMDVANVMGSWVYQAGYPVITVSKLDDKLVFIQNRYPCGNGEIYSVPLSFTSEKEANFENKAAKIWLTQKGIEVPLNTIGVNSDEWIIFNIQQVGLYRVNYSPELWHSIGRGLRMDINKIHKINREVLITELAIGYLKLEELLASDVLEVLLYLVNEPESAVWIEADPLLFSLSRSLFETPVFEDYLKFLQIITRTQLEKVKIEDLDGEPIERVMLKGILKNYNCYSLDDLCVDYETQRLKLYMENDNNPVPEFCTAFRYADFQTFHHFLYELISNPSLKNRFWIVGGISCSLSVAHLSLLAYIVEYERNSFSEYERILIIENMLLRSAAGLEVGFKYLERNIEEISNYTTGLKQAINTINYSDKLNILLDDAIEGGFLTLEYAQNIRNAVDLNLVWQIKHQEAVREWLEDLDDKLVTEGPTTDTTNCLVDETTTEIPATTTDRAGSFFGSLFLMLCVLVFNMKVVN